MKDVDNKRSRLFPDRRRIPGRKTKFIVAIACLIQIYSSMKLIQAKRIFAYFMCDFRLKEEQRRQMQRKMAPFFQSFEDVQYTIVKHRMDLILSEAFKGKGGQEYLEKFNRFKQKGMWAKTYQ